MTKIKTVILIDDDEATNVYHKIVLKSADCVEEIITFQSAEKALEFLSTPADGKIPVPDVIFLDINMPGLDGWDFLDAYSGFKSEDIAKVIIIMLTTSLYKGDEIKAKKYSIVSGFSHKPLDEEVLSDTMKKYLTSATL